MAGPLPGKNPLRRSMSGFVSHSERELPGLEGIDPRAAEALQVRCRLRGCDQRHDGSGSVEGGLAVLFGKAVETPSERGQFGPSIEFRQAGKRDGQLRQGGLRLLSGHFHQGGLRCSWELSEIVFISIPPTSAAPLESLSTPLLVTWVTSLRRCSHALAIDTLPQTPVYG
jgi:hypothetical protein